MSLLAVSCGFLDSPKNGLVSFSGITVGSIAQYSCFPGYLLAGVAKRTCGTNGQWSDEAPTCQGAEREREREREREYVCVLLCLYIVTINSC